MTCAIGFPIHIGKTELAIGAVVTAVLGIAVFWKIGSRLGREPGRESRHKSRTFS